MYRLHKKLPLLIDSRPLFIVEDDIKRLSEELDIFISQSNMKYMNTLKFSKDVLFSHEIRANNSIEGYNDDVELIDEVISKKSSIIDTKRKLRILNMYEGYRYILQRKDISKDNLRHLYEILSKGLLCQNDIDEMGEYYRKNPVYIYYSENISKEPDEGINSNLVDEYMDILFDFLNSNNEKLSKAELFIKSQIMHFYFVYIHPYYDINGRTSRTTSMWYLLNHKSYPFIIFNRAIQLYKNEYYKVIREVKQYHNITYFINYMMEHVIEELEKDYIMETIKHSSNYPLTSQDYQTIHYILSMKSLHTYVDFASFYNHQNERRKVLDIYQEMLLPLLKAGILIEGRPTNKQISRVQYNHVFELNSKLYDNDPSKIKHLIIKK